MEKPVLVIISNQKYLLFNGKYTKINVIPSRKRIKKSQLTAAKYQKFSAGAKFLAKQE